MSDIAIAPDPLLRRYLEPCLATAAIPTPSAVPDAAQRFDVHLRHLRDAVAEVADAGAADRLVAAVAQVGHEAGASLVAVVDAERTWVWPSTTEVGAVRVVPGPLPALAGLLAERQAWIPHAVVEVDRLGADVTLVDARAREIDLTVDGTDLHITRSAPGGWSQRRFQQRAEERWEDNMRLVAERLVQEVGAEGIDLVLVAGGTQVVRILEDQLPADVVGDVVELDIGGRAADGSAERLAELVDEAVRQEAARRRAAAQQSIIGAAGSGRGVTGRDAVLRALFEGIAEAVAVDLSAVEGRHAVVGPEPRQVAADAATLHQLGLTAARVPLVDAVLRGAAATGRAVVMHADAVADLDDGVAASLRH
jgi:hypothetical protein